jgi:uncharacterized membrane protein
MALSHLHLVLNHVPVIGSVIALGLLLLALVRRSADLRRASLEVYVVVGLLALPVYLSGLGAQLEVAARPDVSIAMIRAHHDAALLGSIVMLITAVVAWIGLWQIRRMARPARGVLGAVLLLAVVTLALMGRAANLGGQVRHPEMSVLQELQAADEQAGWMTMWIAKVASESTWVWPAAEALHFIGLWLLFGTVLAVNLRLLGMMKQVPFPVLHRLLPWAVLGLTINVVTGMMFAIGLPSQYAGYPFYWKIGLLMVGAFNLLYLTIVDAPWNVGRGEGAPALARALAGTSIVAWLAVMYFGRMLPFLGRAF